ncbi:MAG: hypothetical protein K0B15_00680 [Lentimicrobium sp.]|nr:hypothetical protein [Lentimicrobium sp.]
MKKQIFLTIILAVLVGVSNVMSQAVGGFPATPVTCTTGPLNPIAGVPYIYSADVNPLTGNAYWYATNATTFMTGGARVAGIELPAGGAVVASGTNYMLNNPVATNPTTTEIIWTTAGLAAVTATNPLFVNIEYTAVDPNCSNNMKVYRIEPVNAFTVDITNWDPDNTAPSGYGAVEDQCYDEVQSASYDLGTGLVDYDFGTNILYYEIVAANFTGSYIANLRLNGLVLNQTALVEWGYASGTYGTSAGTYNGTGAVIDVTPFTVLTDELDTSEGVSIYVRVTVSNNDYEGLSTQNITLAVNGELPTTPVLYSVDNDNCLVPSNYNDVAAQNLVLRPIITPNTGTGFEPQVTP